METQRLLLYLALGFLSLIIYQTWMQDYHTPVTPVQTGQRDPGATGVPAANETLTDAEAPSAADLPNGVPGTEVQAPLVTRQSDARTVSVSTDLLDIKVSTVGATITEALLKDYPISIEQPDTSFMLMSDDPAHYLVAESGLQARAQESAPTHKEIMQVDGDNFVLAEGQDSLSIPFVWSSDNGITVTKTLTFNRGTYEIYVDYQIANASAADWTVNQYRQLKRKPDTKDEKQQFVHTYIGGVVSTMEDRYTKISFGDMKDEDLSTPVTDGWVAMIQHYFAAAWIPQEAEANTAYTRYLPNENRYLIGMVSASQVVPAGGQGSFSSKIFVGPKIQEKLAAAAPHLELTVDYGWLTIIAQPIFWVLKTIHGYIGNWGWAIIFTTFIIKAIFYKLSEASYRSMARMKLLQPKLASLKDRYGDDRAKMGQATMDLYKKEKVNPLGGCLPMIIQIPVFIALYWALLESVELRQAPFMFWIKDLSIRDPFFILPVIMAATMYFQQKLNPAPVDPIQAKVFQFLPLIFGVFFAFFPAGLVLYWVVNNVLSIAQQYYITRHVLADKNNKKVGLAMVQHRIGCAVARLSPIACEQGQMSTYGGDTIAAVATGSGKAGIGIVRVSGPDVPQIAMAVTGQALRARYAYHLPFLSADGSTIDAGIALLFNAPHSFTGESVLELQGHGGAVVLDMLLARVLELGARAALPGEFTQRAFLNDKLDLAQAEAISDLIDSSSTAAVRAAVRSMSGEFSAHVQRINNELIALRVWLEAALDFSEEDIDFLADSAVQTRSVRLVTEFDSLIEKAEQGQRLRDGLSIVIAGATNAGKSSLLNRLSGQETAIVTDIAGTTRDVLHTDITLEGLPLHIVDTAGLRDTSDKVEQLGIQRAIEAVQAADHVLVLIDATDPRLPEGLPLPDGRTTILINKCDCVTVERCQSLMKQFSALLSLSVHTGEGVDKLGTHVLSLAGHDAAVEGVYSARRRHIMALAEARASASNALERLRESRMPELAAEELRQAQQSLEIITGRFDSEDLLGQIFSSFCIGK